MILNRTQFALHFERLQPGLGATTSPLWGPEEYLSKNRSQTFVCVRPVFEPGLRNHKADYWGWCGRYLKGKTFCYSSDDTTKEEWWGFTNPDDIIFWMLRWAK